MASRKLSAGGKVPDEKRKRASSGMISSLDKIAIKCERPSVPHVQN